MTGIKGPPQKVILPADLLQDTKQQTLQTIIKPYAGYKYLPADIGQNGVACLAFRGFLDCFKKANHVSEGTLPDIIWGFEQCGYDPRAVAAGITALRALGYIYYTDPLGNKITEHNFDPKKPIWLRYTQKFLNLLVRL